MATYGYAGDFSSDDDEKVEQYQERVDQAKFDNINRPNKKQIEQEIDSIKRLPYDQEIDLNDEVLAGVLDYYKTQRGPIVDSTRKLYKKIALRLVRGDQEDGTTKEPINGNSQQKQQIAVDNNNSINIISKSAPQPSVADAFSSDDDEVEIVESNCRAKKFDSRVIHDSSNVANDDSMEVDSETPTGPVRQTRQVDLSTSDEDNDESSSEDDMSESDEELNSESDVLEVTPIKPPPSANREKEAVEVLMAMRPGTPKQTESSIKRQPMAHSTPKEAIVETAKKPYTRSQRIATRSATRSTRSSEAALKANAKGASTPTSDVFIENRRVSRRHYTIIAVSIVALLAAFALYYFRSNIANTTAPLRKKISF